MEDKKRIVKVGLFLIVLSFLLHALHFVIFKDLKHIFVYLLGDIAFIPLEVFLVTVVIDQMMESREKEKRLKKVNMLIGLYFQESGLSLLKVMASADLTSQEVQMACAIEQNWKSGDFKSLEKWFNNRKMELDPNLIDYNHLNELLVKQKSLLVNLISNPTLLEHENFSELLLAVSHLQDEMALRAALMTSEGYKPDLKHWKVDMERVYRLSSIQWIRYIEHLQEDYPFLFNAARVMNPFAECSLAAAYDQVRGQA